MVGHLRARGRVRIGRGVRFRAARESSFLRPSYRRNFHAARTCVARLVCEAQALLCE